MSRRVKRPLRPAGDRPKGARPYRGSQAERPQLQSKSHRPGGKPAPRFATSTSRAPKQAGFVPEPEKVVAELPGLPFYHIQPIVRKGELRVNGKRADSKDRIEGGQSIRIPPLKLDTPPKVA